jgi:hypothetical protein
MERTRYALLWFLTGTQGELEPASLIRRTAISAGAALEPSERPAFLFVVHSDPEKLSSPLVAHARSFAEGFASVKHPVLLGVTDGKAVGTYIETAFKLALQDAGLISATEGNAAKGIDLPSRNTDIKVTSISQPQSSSPFDSYKQKIEGLGYDLILFVYTKLDEMQECTVEFRAVRLIPAALTADFQTTRGLRRLILEEEANADEVFAFLIEKNIPADESTLFQYAGWLAENPPAQGWLTMSNALQWRLQYGRIVAGGIEGVTEII